VEGSARRTTAEYLNFLNIAAGSVAEVRYLVDLSCRLGFLNEARSEPLEADYRKVAAGLEALIKALSLEP
jgi:four helix bundle protein